MPVYLQIVTFPIRVQVKLGPGATAVTGATDSAAVTGAGATGATAVTGATGSAEVTGVGATGAIASETPPRSSALPLYGQPQDSAHNGD